MEKIDYLIDYLLKESSRDKFDYSSRDRTNTNAIKSLKNYHSFSTPKNHYINIIMI